MNEIWVLVFQFLRMVSLGYFMKTFEPIFKEKLGILGFLYRLLLSFIVGFSLGLVEVLIRLLEKKI